MDSVKIAELKLACLKLATERCSNCPEDILKIAKEYMEFLGLPG